MPTETIQVHMIESIDAQPATYRADWRHNYSSLKTLVTGTPAEYQWSLANPWQGSDAADHGTIVHAMFLEKKSMTDLAVVIPTVSPKKPTKAQLNAKKPSSETLDAIAFWQAANPSGLIELSMDEASHINGAVDSLDANKWLAEIMDGGRKEWAVYGEINGVQCKGLVDLYKDRQIVDLKTTSKPVNARQFVKSVNDLHYDLQVALYSELVRINEDMQTPPLWHWCVVSMVPPYSLALWECDISWFLNGCGKLDHVLSVLKECFASGKWPGLPATPQLLTMPGWADFDQLSADND